MFFSFEKVTGDSMNQTLHNGDLEICLNAKFTKIEKGDIVNIKSSAIGEQIVKRVIGTEGDTISVDNGKIKVNGRDVEETYLGSPFHDTFAVTVPKGHVFVMGDNRAVSLDSRKDAVGAIPNTEIKSRLIFSISRQKGIGYGN